MPPSGPGQGVRVTEVNPAGLRVLGVQGHVHQSTLSLGEHCGHAVDGRRNRAIGANDAQLSLALGDQQASIGQKRKAPRYAQAGGEGLDAKGVFLGLDDLLGRRSPLQQRG